MDERKLTHPHSSVVDNFSWGIESIVQMMFGK